MTNCGPGGSGSESCCASPEVEGGTYDRTYTNTGTGATGLADPASVSNFRLDKYLVTVGRFRQFANAVLRPDGGAGWKPTPGAGKHTHLNAGLGLVNSAGNGYEPGWVASDDVNVAPTSSNLSCDPNATWTDSPGSLDNLPINCVNWWESYAFCIWDGGFLPSEAEWEYAGGGRWRQQRPEREYPWGTTAPGTACPGSGLRVRDLRVRVPIGVGHLLGCVEHRARRNAGARRRAMGAARSGRRHLGMGPGLVRHRLPIACTDCANLTTSNARA